MFESETWFGSVSNELWFADELETFKWLEVFKSFENDLERESSRNPKKL